jgi:hypothetical protein
MQRVAVEKFFSDFGVEVDPGDASESTLYEPDKQHEHVYSAEEKRVAGRPCRGLFFIRIRATSEKLAAIRADTVVLGATTLKAVDFWRPLTKGRNKPVNNWVADVVEVPYAEIVALRCRRSGLTLTEMQATKYW